MYPASCFLSRLLDVSPVFLMLIHDSFGWRYFFVSGFGGGDFGGGDGTNPRSPPLVGRRGGGGTYPSVMGLSGGIRGLSFTMVGSFLWMYWDVSRFLKLKLHKRTIPKMKAARDVQFSQLVSVVNHFGNLNLGALPSALAESNSDRFSRMADWLVTSDTSDKSSARIKKIQAPLSQQSVSGVGSFAIFSMNVIDRPKAPPARVRIHLSYRPLTSSSAAS